MKTNSIKITPKLLAKLVNEELVRFSKSAKLTERFGPFDASGEDDDKQTGMHAWNFESTAKELIEQSLEPVVEEFNQLIMDTVFEANPPDVNVDDEELVSTIDQYARDMKRELLEVVAKWMKLAVEENAGFL